MVYPISPNTVLLLEDEPLVRISLEEIIAEMGTASVLSFGDCNSALDAARDRPIDCAILDILVGGKRDYRVADVLKTRGVPFIFATGVDPAEANHRFPEAAVLIKPFADGDLKKAIVGALANRHAQPRHQVTAAEPGRRRASPRSALMAYAALSVVGPLHRQIHAFQLQTAHLNGVAQYVRSLPAKRVASLTRARELLSEVHCSRMQMLREVADLPDHGGQSSHVVDATRAFDTVAAGLERAVRLLAD